MIGIGIRLLEAVQHGLPSVIKGYVGQNYVTPFNVVCIRTKSNPSDMHKK